MTLGDLIRRFRILAADVEQPYFWADETLTDWFNDAQEQACIRGRLIREDERPDVCRIELKPWQHTYKLHRSVYELIHVQIKPVAGPVRRLCVLSRELMDAERPGWRENDRPASALVQDDTTLRVVGRIAPGDVLELECYRLPLRPLEDEGDTPEIHQAHHVHLIEWALHKAYSCVDAEVFDPNRAALAERAFTSYFGPMPHSDLRRITREDVIHHVRPDFPY